MFWFKSSFGSSPISVQVQFRFKSSFGSSPVLVQVQFRFKSSFGSSPVSVQVQFRLRLFTNNQYTIVQARPAPKMNSLYITEFGVQRSLMTLPYLGFNDIFKTFL